MKAPAWLAGFAAGVAKLPAALWTAARTLARKAAALVRPLSGAIKPGVGRSRADGQGQAAPADAPDTFDGKARARSLRLAAAGMAAVVILGLVVILARGRPEQAAPTPAAALPYDFPSGGPALYRLLVVPGPEPGELPFPLAREPKRLYTDADVEAQLPAFEGLDLAPIIERRKAELEAIFNAVD
ncbi:MAG: hypothetical protein JW923_06325 [Spirochaetales bacterium]|nr:hypothetical protein [Spirochaetales bacterium]MBP7262878.1 hypothetical protein [Spirochaetia bacterium]